MSDPAPRLALPDRRGLAAYQAETFPPLLAAIQAAAGFEVPVEVRWLEIAIPGEGPRYQDPGTFTDVYFRPLEIALRRVTRDEMGREALAEGLRRIAVGFDDATAPLTSYEDGVRFSGGTLHLNFRPAINAHDVDARAQAIVTVLEAGL